jgi:hypothetical protein
MGVSGRGKASGSGTSGMGLAGKLLASKHGPRIGSRDRVRRVDRRPLKGVVRQRKSLWFWCFEHVHSGKLIGLKTWTPHRFARPSLPSGAQGAESPPDLAPFATVF